MNITAKQTAEKQELRFKARLADPREVWGIPWGIPKLDKYTHGIRRKEVIDQKVIGGNDLITLIADTGVGKTSFAAWVAVNVAEYFLEHEPDKEVRFLTLEDPAELLQDRVAASESGVPLERITTGMYLSKAQEDCYYIALQRLSKLPIRYIDEVASLTDLGYAVSRKSEEGKKCGFWIIDHLHYVPGANSSENSVAALNEVVEGLDKLKKNVSPGLVLAQMNKDALRRVDKRPQRTDVRNNTSLSNASTLILGLYREDLYVTMDIENKPRELPAELNILKNRHGGTGLVKLRFIPDRMLWEVE